MPSWPSLLQHFEISSVIFEAFKEAVIFSYIYLIKDTLLLFLSEFYIEVKGRYHLLKANQKFFQGLKIVLSGT